MSDQPSPIPPSPPVEVPVIAHVAQENASPAIPRRQSWLVPFGSLRRSGELTIYHHSNLFYWWPVWAFGFLFALVTYWENNHLAIVPAGTSAVPKRQVISEDGQVLVRDILLLRENAQLVTQQDNGTQKVLQPTIFVSRHSTMGTIFLIVLLLVIFITNIALRGLWSHVVLMAVVMLSAIFAAAGWWDSILSKLGQLQIYINLGGYFLIATVLFVFWVFNLLVMDKQTYVVFTPGQMRLCQEIGGGEFVYDTTGISVQKQRMDFFRHWILGFGSGDLVINVHGLAHPIHIPNVLGAGRVVKAIEDILQERMVVADTPETVKA